MARYIGDKVGKLTLLAEYKLEGKHGWGWEASCECGNICRVTNGYLCTRPKNVEHSCGCSKIEYRKTRVPPTRFIDMEGEVIKGIRIGKLAHSTKSSCYWHVTCHCGNTYICSRTALLRNTYRGCRQCYKKNVSELSTGNSTKYFIDGKSLKSELLKYGMTHPSIGGKNALRNGASPKEVLDISIIDSLIRKISTFKGV